MIVIEYPHTDCSHEYPNDWDFGGANGLDPRADPRWMPTTYQYLDKELNEIHITQVPLCDHAAKGLFKGTVERYKHRPVCYIIADRPDGRPEMILRPGVL